MSRLFLPITIAYYEPTRTIYKLRFGRARDAADYAALTGSADSGLETRCMATDKNAGRTARLVLAEPDAFGIARVRGISVRRCSGVALPNNNVETGESRRTRVFCASHSEGRENYNSNLVVRMQTLVFGVPDTCEAKIARFRIRRVINRDLDTYRLYTHDIPIIPQRRIGVVVRSRNTLTVQRGPPPLLPTPQVEQDRYSASGPHEQGGPPSRIAAVMRFGEPEMVQRALTPLLLAQTPLLGAFPPADGETPGPYDQGPSAQPNTLYQGYYDDTAETASEATRELENDPDVGVPAPTATEISLQFLNSLRLEIDNHILRTEYHRLQEQYQNFEPVVQVNGAILVDDTVQGSGRVQICGCCETVPANAVAVECGHLYACIPCTRRFQAPRCPLCQTETGFVELRCATR